MPVYATQPFCHTIAVVSRNHLTRLGLQAFIAQHRHLRLIGQAASSLAAESLVARTKPQILLLELDAGCDLMTCAVEVRAILPTIRIIILCNTSQSDCTAIRHTQAIDGIVLTTQPLTALFAAIDTLIPLIQPEMPKEHRERAISPHETGPAKLSTASPVPLKRPEPFTKRESDVLVLLAEGLSNKDIARRLCICPTTVRHHLSHMFNKLDVGSRQQLLLRAQEHGLVQFK
ncbi:MAG: response regulator transcription factor [Nitrospira sp.]|nr:response regulator transcription factor [Nitrospira sp.]